MSDIVTPDKVEICREITCAFTGARDLKPGTVDEELFLSLLKTVVKMGKTTFLCGMARGFDLLAGECVLKLKELGYNVKLVACIPCPKQEKSFTDEDKLKYGYVLEKCDEKILVSSHYYDGCMLRRNRYMVDNCSLIIAHMEEKEEKEGQGGTGYTVNYGKSAGIEVLAI